MKKSGKVLATGWIRMFGNSIPIYNEDGEWCVHVQTEKKKWLTKVHIILADNPRRKHKDDR